MKNTIQENYEIELIRKQTDLQKRSGHLRLFYIVDGSAVFSVNGVPCSVRHGDILQASRGDICELKNPASLLCVCLSVNPLVFHTLENPDPQFSINSAADRNALYDDLREKIADFLIAEAVSLVRKGSAMSAVTGDSRGTAEINYWESVGG